jgi:lipoprotein-anchoring transpeptidase ErfK/SrfK
MLRFYDGEELLAETPVVIGKDETRTPTGRFYVTDTVEQANPSGVFGPLALATSAYSEQLDVFDNGVPVIALHGTNQPELVGQAASNGCVRMPNDVVTRIGQQVQLGTPVEIFA